MNVKSFSVLAIVGLSLGMVSLLVVLNKNTEVRSKAAEQIIIPTRFIMPPKTQLQVPYIRLVKRESTDPNNVVVDVFARTGSEEVLETVVHVSYDDSLLQLTEQDIRNMEVFPVYNIERVGSGDVKFSLFTSEDAGYAPIQLLEEVPIARLTLTKKIPNIPQTSMKLIFNGDRSQSSGMYGPRSENGEISRNMISSVEGTIIE